MAQINLLRPRVIEKHFEIERRKVKRCKAKGSKKIFQIFIEKKVKFIAVESGTREHLELQLQPDPVDQQELEQVDSSKIFIQTWII